MAPTTLSQRVSPKGTTTDFRNLRENRRKSDCIFERAAASGGLDSGRIRD
jgi:hypothetical protein